MFQAELSYTSQFIREFDGSLDLKLWMKLLDEETKELVEALQGTDRAHVLKEAADVLYVIAPVMAISQVLYDMQMLGPDILAQIDKLIQAADKPMLAVSTMFSEETVADALKLVHESNMSKLGDDGKPIRREDGKILKSKNYKEPDLTRLAA